MSLNFPAWTLGSLSLVVLVSSFSLGCGAANQKKSADQGGTQPQQNLGADPCNRNLIDGPAGQEPVPVMPGGGQPGYQPVPTPSTINGPQPPHTGPQSPPTTIPGNPCQQPGKPIVNGSNPPPPTGPIGNPGNSGPNPGQIPTQGCTTGCPKPPTGGKGEPFPPLPPQAQLPTSECGKPGIVCFPNGSNPGQFPAQAGGGKKYDRGDLETCMRAFSQRGIATQGGLALEADEVKTISVFGSGSFADMSKGPRIVMLRATNVAGGLVGGVTDIYLTNPQALYCVKSVSVLDNVNIGSCWSNNVVVLKDVSVLSNRNIVPLRCP